ncbi:STAS domain-containing protein [Actinophytocola sp.]|uniref:STAS domain-containing protein n=1 Tax=Actinophytocola sp. TaxID=1872138 RepID=UPI003899B69B
MPMTAFNITVERSADAVVLRVRGELDIATAPTLRESILLALHGGPKILVIDLSAVTFLAAAGLVALTTANRKGTDVRVVVASRPCERTIHLTGFDAILTLHGNLTDALR